jgi:hypothetical protein
VARGASVGGASSLALRPEFERAAPGRGFAKSGGATICSNAALKACESDDDEEDIISSPAQRSSHWLCAARGRAGRALRTPRATSRG